MPGSLLPDAIVPGWTEVAPGVFQRRYEPEDVSVGVIVGSTGITLVDTRNNPAEAEEIIRDVRDAFALPIVTVVNTHAHYDHTFGNQVFAEHGIPIYGHHLIPRHFAHHEGPRLREVQEQPECGPDRDWGEVRLTPPTVPVEAPLRIDPGGRTIELLPISAGHTDTDLAALVPDARAWFLGDVIEESGPPMFGSGSYPLDWPDALEGLLDRIRSGDVLVPGHGSVVDRDFVERQADRLRSVAEWIRDAFAAGRSLDDVRPERSLEEYWSESFLRSALEDGYAQLSSARNLPDDGA
ncbi:MBL fold metallo-hydrolase [Aeromicrobium sp. PE09-221]|uniref:MBL fold metallo-hydrolase n=1 Tax=Aeromicrobium sp. PE09-221 TaxID=1898043 RepID=UPI001F474879|nr:MBL fold metallo-hydrolase [Aeromicrobium sp. PE09-221]